MFELAGALIIVLVALQVCRRLLARGVVLSSQSPKPESDVKGQRSSQRGSRREQEVDRRRQPKQKRAANGQQQLQREQAAKRSETGWWSDLGVSPDAGMDEIRRTYLIKIRECHPDRVAWSAPELLELAEIRARTLNAAYSEAIRQRGGKAAGTA